MIEDSETELRAHLLNHRAESQKHYDTYLITLSGGGLAVSLTFVHDIIGPNPIIDQESLVVAWFFWLLSIVCIICSFLTARFAYEKALKEDVRASGRPGGWLSWTTDILNVIAGILFVFGTAKIIWFANQNLGGTHGTKTAAPTETAAPSIKTP